MGKFYVTTLVAIFFICVSKSSFAQPGPPLAGAYTINQGLPTSGTNFNSFTDFSDSLTARGINASVTATVTAGSGPYTEQVIFQNISGISAANTITIQGNGETITSDTAILSTGSNPNRHIIRLTSLQYFTINNLHVDMFPGSTAFIGIHIFTTGNHITISNSVVSMGTATSTLLGAIAATGSASSLLTGGTFSDLLITGNSSTGGGYGVVLYGTNNTTTINNIISNNTVNSSNTNGIYVQQNGGLLITGNHVNFSASNGIQVAGAGNINTIVEKNFVSCTNPTTTGTLRGMYIFGSNPASPNKIINNLIWNMNAPAASIYGITNRTTGAEFYFNTIILDDAAATGTVSLGFDEDLSNLGSTLKNNIFYITRGASNYSSAISLFSTSNAATTTNSDYNVFYTSAAAHVAVKKGTVTSNPPTATYHTLTDWQTASGDDMNSIATDPLFQTGTGIPTSGVINGEGTPISGITTDIVGVTRSNPPDPGAYEFAPPANDAAVTGFVLPSIPHCANTLDVKFLLTNAGGNTLTSVTINWTVNGVPQTVVNWTGSLASGATTTVTLGTVPVTGLNTYDFTATTSNPNGSPDVNPANDSYTYNDFRRGLAGAFTINGSAAASLTNYQSFQEISDILSQYGICSAVTITVMNGPYTQQVVFNAVPGTSSTNTITLNGNGQTLQFNPTDANNDHILQLNGINHMIVENLTVNSLHATQGRGIHITNGASKLAIRNNTVHVSLTNSTSIAFGIIISGDNWLLDGSFSDSVIIESNTVSGGYSAIQLSGVHWTQPLTRIKVLNNNVLDWYGFGVYCSYTNGVIVSGNKIRRPNRTNSGSDAVTPAGITVPAGSLNFLLEKNSIYDLHVNMPGDPSISRGFYISGTTTAPTSGSIRNNLVYGMNNNGAQYGIQDNSVTGPVTIYHNTIVLNNATGASTSNTNALNISNSSAQTGLDIRNNILFVTRGGTGIKRIIDVGSAGTSFISNYNAAYLNAPGGTSTYGQIGSTNYITFADWQATGKDANSVHADPMFTNAAIGNFIPTNAAVEGTTMGTASVGVTDDIVGIPRGANPDPGAFEWTVPSCSGANGGTAATSSGPFCTSGTGTITASGYSAGIGITYQWQWSTDNFVSSINDLTGQTNPATASTGSISATTYYRLKVTCTNGPVNAYSNIVTIVVNQPVTITNQPANQTVCAGTSVTFSVTATGTITGYQWRKGAVNIPGANAATYTINPVAAGDAGVYDVVITGACGNVTSNQATLTVNAVTAITAQPVSQTVCAGNSVSFSVTATGTSLTYQWRKNGSNIGGATAATYTINPVAAGNAGNYDVVVSGACGNVTSTIAVLTVNASTSITVQPVSQTICSGSAVTFNVTATGTGLTYQWRKNGSNISGATAASFTINPVTSGDAGNYDVVVTGSCGSATSNTVSLNVSSAGSWIGVINSDWNTAGNWCGGIPTAATDVTIPASAPNMPVLANGNGSARDITVNSGASLTVGIGGTLNIYGNVVAGNAAMFNSAAGNLNFRGSGVQFVPAFSAINVNMNGVQLNLNGNAIITGTLTLTSGHIVLANWLLFPASISGGSAGSHIVTNNTGYVSMNLPASATLTIPISPDLTSYNPVVITSNASHVADAMTFRVNAGVYINPYAGPSYTGNVVNRMWVINEGTPGGSNFNVSFQWSGNQELPGFQRNRSHVMIYNGSSWDIAPDASASGSDPFTLSRNNVTTLGAFAVSSTIIPRPKTGIYPNPARDYINVVMDLPTERPVIFSIYNSLGQLVHRSQKTVITGLSQSTLNLRNLNTGTYTLKISYGGNLEFMVRKFVKAY